jgi:hypothetical protein
MHSLAKLTLAALACWTTPAAAQISFSSVQVKVDGGSLTNNSSARLFSEGGRDFTFRAFGCEWDVRSPVPDALDRAYMGGFVEGFTEEMGGTAEVELISGLVSPRPSGSPSGRPASYSCSSYGRTSVLVVLRHRGKPFAIVFQSSYKTSGGRRSWDGGAKSSMMFSMKKDWFTPAGEREAFRVGGEIAVAIFKAWITSRR